MKNRLNTPFLAFLAWMAGLLTLVVLMSSCNTTTRYATYDGRVYKAPNSTSCSAYD